MAAVSERQDDSQLWRGSLLTLIKHLSHSPRQHGQWRLNERCYLQQLHIYRHLRSLLSRRGGCVVGILILSVAVLCRPGPPLIIRIALVTRQAEMFDQ